jgi:hypothetical protein
MRRGTRPPFVEESDIRDRRVHRNAIVRAQRGDGVAVVDIERLFVDDQGAIRLTMRAARSSFRTANTCRPPAPRS